MSRATSLTESISTTPIQAQRSIRRDELRCLTSAKAGQIIPLAYVPMLREDALTRGTARVRFEMAETARTLLNAINVRVDVHFIPMLAFERFMDLGSMNRAYKGVPETKNGPVTPYFDTVTYNRDHAFWKTLGVHMPQGHQINGTVLEAYNTLVNWRRRARSLSLPQRDRYDTTLAQGFWNNPAMNGIVPSFDQAAADGEVYLKFASNKLPVQGIGINGSSLGNGTQQQTKITGGKTVKDSGWSFGEANHGKQIQILEDINNKGFPRIYAELSSRGVSLSLSNIDLAKTTAAFAELRQQYRGLDDEHIIDMLMSGIRVPDEQMAQPILLDRKSTILGYSQRFATDGANLDKYVTTGETFLDLTYRTPPMNTGGVIMITAEIVPEQMFERQQDYFIAERNVENLPNYLRDFLDPEKVSIVRNRFVDTLHSNGDGTFGYAPLNHMWNRHAPRIGGKFMRPIDDKFNEERQRIWSATIKDPKLTSDFYLVNTLPQTVFADQKADPFEITTLGMNTISGLTVFGKGLEESNNDYTTIMDQVDTSRIGQ